MKKSILFVLVGVLTCSLVGCASPKVVKSYKTKDIMSLPGEVLDMSEEVININFDERIDLTLASDTKVGILKDTISYKFDETGFSEDTKKKFVKLINDSFSEDYKKEGVKLLYSEYENKVDFILTLTFKDIDKSSYILQNMGIDSVYFDEDGNYPLDMLKDLMKKNEYKEVEK